MPIDDRAPLVLGSGSPRRRQILSELRIPVRVSPVDIDEEPFPLEAPLPYLERIVSAKLSAASSRVGPDPAGALLVADTTVIIDERIVGKPRDVEEAGFLLGRLVGRMHTVFTRYAISKGPSWEVPVVARTVLSKVWMRDAGADEIARYAASGEGLDKAGAYAVQGLGAFLVERIDGSYTNVIGLPACEVILDLRDNGLLGEYP